MKIQPLKVNDKIAIVATGKKISNAEIALAVKTFEQWGLQVVIGNSIGAEKNYLAGNDELRAKDLQQALTDKTIKAVFFARGGYGTVRILDKIDFSVLTRNPKWLIGFSDVTALHTHVNNLVKIPTIHGIMPIFFPSATQESIESCRKALFNGTINYNFSNSSEFNKVGNCEGELIGGNLAILASTAGSSSALNCQNKILFIEDLYEHYYKIDRMLQTLKRSGSLDGINGLIVGSFTEMEKGVPPFSSSVEEVISPYFSSLNIPQYYHFPSGHIDNNHALIFGQKVKMEVKNHQIILASVK